MKIISVVDLRDLAFLERCPSHRDDNLREVSVLEMSSSWRGVCIVRCLSLRGVFLKDLSIFERCLS